MIELYCAVFADLLAKADIITRERAAGKEENQIDKVIQATNFPKIDVKQEKNGSVLIQNAEEKTASDSTELQSIITAGFESRKTAATAMNAESSRSHLIVIVKIVTVNKETKEQVRGKLLLCDLAGCERLAKSEVSGQQQKEAIEINKSLTALGDVIESLTKNAKMVPYRNHKLTQLMQDSLGGTSKTLMFMNCSPASSNTDETAMSLKYAQRAKMITNDTKKNKKK